MIYLDNAATTELCEEAREAMRPYLEEDYGNPSSIYLFAQRAKMSISGGGWTRLPFWKPYGMRPGLSAS